MEWNGIGMEEFFFFLIKYFKTAEVYMYILIMPLELLRQHSLPILRSIFNVCSLSGCPTHGLYLVF